MSTLSREEARQIIEDIRIDNGAISPDDRKKTPPSVLASIETLQRKLGASTKTYPFPKIWIRVQPYLRASSLATNLYSKDTRFVFELIQNAEDNNYTWATALGEEP